MRCLIISSQARLKKRLVSYVEKIRWLELVAACSDIRKAVCLLEDNPIDLLVVDPQTPEGIELLRALQNKYQVIVVSAGKKYAADAYEVDATDYIAGLNYSRFSQGVRKAYNLYKNSAKNADLVFIYSENSFKKISPGAIYYIEAYGDYVNIISEEGKFMLNNSLKNLESKLQAQFFVRVHRKFIVNFHKIDFLEKNLLYIGKTGIPVGRLYREKLLQKLNLL